MKWQAHRKFPRTYKDTIHVYEDELMKETLRSKKTTVLKHGSKVSIAPRYDSDGTVWLAKLGAKHKNRCNEVALALCALIYNKQQGNVVSASQKELVELLGLSLKTIADNLKFLQEHEVIVKVGQQDYYVTPHLCWFGDDISWANELEMLKVYSLKETYQMRLEREQKYQEHIDEHSMEVIVE